MRLGVLLGFFIGTHAMAYVPQAGFVLNHALTERSGLKSIEWTAKISNHYSKVVNSEESDSVFKESLRVDYGTGKVQISFSSPSDQPLGSIQTTLAKLSRFGKFWLVVSLDPNSSRVKSALEELHILPAADQEVRFSRVNGKVTWNWGSAGDPVSEVDFEKDEFLPIRFQMGQESDGVLFQSFAMASSTAKVPKAVDVRMLGQSRMFEFELKSIKTDPPVKEKFVESPVSNAGIKDWIKLVR
jgi:hypothetical protein